MNNAARLAQIGNGVSTHWNDPLGRGCKVDGNEGRIDAIFIDLRAAIDCGIISEGWYEAQNVKPLTLKTQRWYSVVLPQGAVLIGERELILT